MAAPLAIVSTPALTTPADVLVLPLLSGKEGEASLSQSKLLSELDELCEGALRKHLAHARFTAERGSVVSTPLLGRASATHLIVVGLGAPSALTAATLTEAVAIGVRTALTVRPEHVAVAATDVLGLTLARSLAGLSHVALVGLGARLGAYQFDRYYGEKQRAQVTLKKLSLFAPKAAGADLQKALKIADGVCLARDLVNEPPNELYPETFAGRARAVAKANSLKCVVWDEKAILKAGMNLHYAVGQGSAKPPRFVHLTYRPANPKGRVAFVGKGLTFDSGGLCIKPMQGMAEMKSDMAGGAAVLGMMAVVAALGVSVEVHGIIGMAENMPDANAYRPADVLRSLSGKGVEIINTDAEGRLVLADALTYAARLDPDFIVDAATLTGATLVSLGAPYSAFFTGSESLAGAMTAAAATAGESFWRMPLIEELAQELKSDITDLQHTGQRFGGAISAALFLREFVDGKPWIHTDIPGATFRDRASGLHPKGGTGHAVLTFLELVCAHDQTPLVPIKPSAAPTERTRGRATTGRKKDAAPPIRSAVRTRKPSKKAN